MFDRYSSSYSASTSRMRGRRLLGGGLLAAALLLLPGVAAAQPQLKTRFDPGFGASERVYGATYQWINGQAERAVLIGGAFTVIDGRQQAGLARLFPDGSLDESFLGNTLGTVNVVTIQRSTDKILVGGSFAELNGTPLLGLGRLNPDGSLDSSFLARVGGSVFTLAQQNDGKIIAGGFFHQANGQPVGHIARFLPTGALDTSFQMGTGADGYITSIAVDYWGRIVVGGAFSSFNGLPRSRIVRLTANGAVDTTFTASANGVVKSLAIEASNRILVGGDFTQLNGYSRSYFGRLGNDGSFDHAFNNLGGPNGPVEAVAVEYYNGNILVGGTFSSFRGQPHQNLVHLRVTGEIDPYTSLDADGPVLKLHSDYDGLLVAGDFRFLAGATRYRIGALEDRVPVDRNFTPQSYGGYSGLATVNQAYGGVLVGGLFDLQNSAGPGLVRNLARFSGSGLLDTTFRPNPNGRIEALLELPDGKILVGGDFTGTAASQRSYLMRLLPNGAEDSSFVPTSIWPVEAFARQVDGRVLMVANRRDGFRETRITRLLASGAVDPSFQLPILRGTITTVVVQPDGRILVGAEQPIAIGQANRYLFRLHADGSFDSSFFVELDHAVTAVLPRADGRIWVAGYFSKVGGVSRPALARLHADGALDTGFSTAARASSSLKSLTQLTNGQLVVGGILYGPDNNLLCLLCRMNDNGTVDPTYLPTVTTDVFGVLVQPEGHVVAGLLNPGVLNGQWIHAAGRLLNIDPVAQSLEVDAFQSRINWWRSGVLPEFGNVTFEISTDGGVTYPLVVEGTRVEGGWQASGVSLPTTSYRIRATGTQAAGYRNASSTLVRQVSLFNTDPNAPPEE